MTLLVSCLSMNNYFLFLIEGCDFQFLKAGKIQLEFKTKYPSALWPVH